MIDQIIDCADVLSSALCEQMIADPVEEEWSEAVIGGGWGEDAADRSIRRSAVRWLPDEHPLAMIVWQLPPSINQSHFGFELAHLVRRQLTRYGVGEHYAWHQDQFWPHPGQETLPLVQDAVRKCSISLQLPAPDPYKGGGVLAQDAYGALARGLERGEDWRRQGYCVAFPSTTMYCVQPVVTGV